MFVRNRNLLLWYSRRLGLIRCLCNIIGMNAARYERCRTQTRGITPSNFMQQAFAFGEGALSLRNLHAVGHVLQRHARIVKAFSDVVTTINIINYMWTLSPPKMNWFSPKLWKFLLRGNFSGITLILSLNWTSYTHIQMTISESPRFLTLIFAFLRLCCIKGREKWREFFAIFRLLSPFVLHSFKNPVDDKKWGHWANGHCKQTKTLSFLSLLLSLWFVQNFARSC